jgi:hypothetical protein
MSSREFGSELRGFSRIVAGRIFVNILVGRILTVAVL